MTGYASIHGSDASETIDTSPFGSRNDYIDAKDGNDTISTGGGNDTVHAGSGKDLVYAGQGNDIVFGGAAQDTLFGEGGNDRMDGGNTDDILFGGTGDDTLLGSQGDDTLLGGMGDDVLSGDAGTVGSTPGGGGSGSGSNGEDVFVFESNFGDDIITDFDLSRDVLEIEENINGLSIDSPADLAAYVTEVGGSAVISFPNGDSITLQGVTREALLDNLDDVVSIV